MADSYGYLSVLLWYNSHIGLRGYFVDYKYGNVRRTCPKNGEKKWMFLKLFELDEA